MDDSTSSTALTSPRTAKIALWGGIAFSLVFTDLFVGGELGIWIADRFLKQPTAVQLILEK